MAIYKYTLGLTRDELLEVHVLLGLRLKELQRRTEMLDRDANDGSDWRYCRNEITKEQTTLETLINKVEAL